MQAERGIALCLLGLLRRSMAQVGRSCWLEPRLDGAVLDISQPRDMVLPARGMLTLGLADLRDTPAGAQPLSQQQLEAVLQVGLDCFRKRNAAWGATSPAVHYQIYPRLVVVLSLASLRMLHGVGLGLGELVLADSLVTQDVDSRHMPAPAETAGWMCGRRALAGPAATCTNPGAGLPCLRCLPCKVDCGAGVLPTARASAV